MALPPPPNPPPPPVVLIDPRTGQATQKLTEFLSADLIWKKKVMAAIATMGG